VNGKRRSERNVTPKYEAREPDSSYDMPGAMARRYLLPGQSYELRTGRLKEKDTDTEAGSKQELTFDNVQVKLDVADSSAYVRGTIDFTGTRHSPLNPELSYTSILHSHNQQLEHLTMTSRTMIRPTTLLPVFRAASRRFNSSSSSSGSGAVTLHPETQYEKFMQPLKDSGIRAGNMAYVWEVPKDLPQNDFIKRRIAVADHAECMSLLHPYLFIYLLERG